MRFLIVAGDEHHRERIAEVLGRISAWRSASRGAPSLSEALAALEDDPDVVLLDLDLEEGRALSALRAAAPEVPIVALTTAERDGAGIDATRRGADDFLLYEHLDDEVLRRAVRHASQRRLDALTLMRTNAGLEDFARMIAHEVRSPLSTLSFACELLRSQDLDEKGEKQIERIRGGVREIAELIDQLLIYSSATRAEAHQSVDLEELVGEVLIGLAAEIESAEPRVEVGELPTVLGARSQLQLVFHHLIENALRHGGASPTVRLSAERRGNRGWEIVVADDGPGVEPGEHRRIFRVFERGANAESEGAGLGLAICRRAVEAHGGVIRVDSEPGGGCAFRFTLPDEPPPMEVPSG